MSKPHEYHFVVNWNRLNYLGLKTRNRVHKKQEASRMENYHGTIEKTSRYSAEAQET